jgi:D-amino-acid dehydrogenase
MPPCRSSTPPSWEEAWSVPPSRTSSRAGAVERQGIVARVAVGATVEGVGFTPEVTAGGIYEVLRETLRVMPGLASATLKEVRVGLRPVSVDDMPVLGAIPGVPGFFVATGHGANGLLLGPVSGALVADVVCGKDPAVDLAPFSAERFSARA